jgi:hypothetical protein
LSLTSAFNRAPWAFLPVALLALGCTRHNPDYCDQSTRCSAGRVCDLDTSTCRVPDAAVEADAATPDAPVDRARDAMPDAGDAANTCAVDEDCAASTAGPTCVRGLCKKCMGANDCKASLVCATDTGRCVECTATEGCASTPASPVCVANKCVPCTQQAGACQARYVDMPVCNPAGQCVGCVESVRDCLVPNKPICGAASACVACPDDAACTTKNPALPACDSGACVECTDDKHCASPTRPICDTQLKKCVPCTADAQCVKKQGTANPGVCLAHQDGRCAVDGETIYVQNGPGCSMSAGAGGTATAPFCFSQDGLNAVLATKRVVVLRGPDALTPFTAAPVGGEVTVVGQTNATIAPGAFVGIKLTAGDLYVRGVTVNGSTQTGVTVENATLRMNRCSITGNRGGLQVMNGGFDVSNTVIAANKGALVPGTAVTYGGDNLKSAVGRPLFFRNNTIVDNEAIGLVCSESYPIKGLLVTNNAVEQILGCTPTASSKVGGNPAFNPARPYHLQASSPCVNAGEATDFPADDLDGEPRPQMSASDCGADEFKP